MHIMTLDQAELGHHYERSHNSNVKYQDIANQARKYCLNKQNREFPLDGACHENVIGSGDYVRLHTDYRPIIVWGVVSHASETDTADTIDNVSELTTHFWLQLAEKYDQDDSEFYLHPGIVDVYTNNPLVGDISDYIESGIAYGGEIPECYNVVDKFIYYGQVTPFDLSSKETFKSALNLKAVEPF